MFRMVGRAAGIAVGVGLVAAPSLAAWENEPATRSGLRIAASPSVDQNLVANASFEEGAPGVDVPAGGLTTREHADLRQVAHRCDHHDRRRVVGLGRGREGEVAGQDVLPSAAAHWSSPARRSPTTEHSPTTTSRRSRRSTSGSARSSSITALSTPRSRFLRTWETSSPTSRKARSCRRRSAGSSAVLRTGSGAGSAARALPIRVSRRRRQSLR